MEAKHRQPNDNNKGNGSYPRPPGDIQPSQRETKEAARGGHSVAQESGYGSGHGFSESNGDKMMALKSPDGGEGSWGTADTPVSAEVVDMSSWGSFSPSVSSVGEEACDKAMPSL